MNDTASQDTLAFCLILSKDNVTWEWTPFCFWGYDTCFSKCFQVSFVQRVFAVILYVIILRGNEVSQGR
jgi:hypothetical protein